MGKLNFASVGGAMSLNVEGLDVWMIYQYQGIRKIKRMINIPYHHSGALAAARTG